MTTTLTPKQQYDKDYRARNRKRIREQQREWRDKNPDKIRQYAVTHGEYRQQWARDNADKCRAANSRKRAERLAIVHEYKDRPCVDCGIWYPPEVMDLDHVRGVKCGNVSALSAKASVTRLKAELEKCEVRCANCHRLRHLRLKRSL